MTQRGTVLVCEDEDHIADLIGMYLDEEGFRVVRTASGEEALVEAERSEPRVAVLDVMLPGIDGFEVCRELRGRGKQLPVLFLTARDGEIDKVLGLELGADDYLTKPFSPRELVARVKAILRRSEREPESDVIESGDTLIDAGRREVRDGNGKSVSLTAKEFDLLWFLAENKGLVMSREQILRHVWGYEWAGETRTVDVHIRQVRKKLEDMVEIRTVWGVGYQLAE